MTDNIKLLNTEPDPAKDDDTYTYLVCVNGVLQSFVTNYKLMIGEDGSFILQSDEGEMIINADKFDFIRKFKGDMTDDDTHGHFRYTDKTKH